MEDRKDDVWSTDSWVVKDEERRGGECPSPECGKSRLEAEKEEVSYAGKYAVTKKWSGS